MARGRRARSRLRRRSAGPRASAGRSGALECGPSDGRVPTSAVAPEQRPARLHLRAIIIIPARYGSTRLPAKALRHDTGRFLIEHVYERAAGSRLAGAVVIATDDERIREAAQSFGAPAVMTSPACASGTDRVAEAARALDADVIVNLQGDEPEMDVDAIDRVIALASEDGVAIATAAARSRDEAAFRDPAVVKAVVAADRRALYFTRAPAPYDRERKGALGEGGFLWHLGIYGFRRAALERVAALPPSPLERTEMLEQLRWLEDGLAIHVAEVARASSGIDTEEQYQAFLARWRARERDPATGATA